MYALQIAIALAVSMLIFSTLATMVVEIIWKVSRLRQFGLRKMLEGFYQTEVKQRLQALLERDGGTVEDMPDFVAKLTAMTGGASTLSTIEFIRRLADTEIGKRIARRADSEVDALIDDIVERYEDCGRRASQIFRRYSALGTVSVAVVVALFLNINGLTVFRTFQKNRELTQAIASQAEQAMSTYQVQAALLKNTIAAENPPKAAVVDSDIEKLKGSVGELKKAVDDAKKLGLPIGWSQGGLFNAKDMEPMGGFVWFLTTVITGLLIGLGGPFWFDIVKRLSVVSQVTGALIRPPPGQKAGGDGNGPAKSAAAAPAGDPKTAFRTVVNAQRIIDGAAGEVSGFPGSRALRL